MKTIFNDWQAKGITSVLHEKRGGYANNTASIYGLAKSRILVLKSLYWNRSNWF